MAERSDGIVGAPLLLAGLGFWSAQTPNVGALIGQESASLDELPPANMLGARARGRASVLTLMFAEVAHQAASAAGHPIEAFATIFGSAYGEMERLIQLLETMQGPNAEVSPLRFQTSVHNAAAGQISIVAKNQRFSTSIAAGANTVAMAMVEAACWMHWHQAPLLVVIGDEAPPRRISSEPPYPALAAAFAFMPANTAAAGHLLLHHEVTASEPASVCHLAPGNNPCKVLAPLVAWLARAQPPGFFPLSNLAGPGYCIERT